MEQRTTGDAVFVGIDVSKAVLDVAVHLSGEQWWKVANDSNGISQPVLRLQSLCGSTEKSSVQRWRIPRLGRPAELHRPMSRTAATRANITNYDGLRAAAFLRAFPVLGWHEHRPGHLGQRSG